MLCYVMLYISEQLTFVKLSLATAHSFSLLVVALSIELENAGVSFENSPHKLHNLQYRVTHVQIFLKLQPMLLFLVFLLP